MAKSCGVAYLATSPPSMAPLDVDLSFGVVREFSVPELAAVVFHGERSESQAAVRGRRPPLRS